MDLVALLERHNAGREPERLALKYRAMRSSAYRFFRGTCALFYERLPDAGVFRSAPLVWSCGDLHMENFGSYKGDSRLVYFDINDFDESALAPASWDLVRMLTSIQLAAADVNATRSKAETLSTAFVNAYAESLTAGKSFWIDRDTASGEVRALLDRVRERTRTDWLNSRSDIRNGVRTLRTDGVKALAATDAQRQRIATFITQFARTQDRPEFYRVLDVARRIAGTGSLGIERYAILVEGKGSPDGNYFLDLKAAMPSALAAHVVGVQPSWASDAERVVTVQRRMQGISMAFLHVVQIDRTAYVLRALLPSEDRITINRAALRDGALDDVVATMGRVVAWAQLRSAGRQGASSTDDLVIWGGKQKWKAKLQELAIDCAAQCQRDAAEFASAYDRGAFHA